MKYDMKYYGIFMYMDMYGDKKKKHTQTHLIISFVIDFFLIRELSHIFTLLLLLSLSILLLSTT